MDNCLTPDHFVLTPDGFKKISDLFSSTKGSVYVTVPDEELNLRHILLANTKDLE